MSNLDYLKPELERVLQKTFYTCGIEEVVSLGEEDGRNADRHVKARVGKSQWYGFKAYPQARRHGEDDRIYAEQDLMLAKIAQIVNAPHFSEIVQVCDIKEEPFLDWTVNVVKWLPAALILTKLDSDSLRRIQMNGETFLYEYGQWVAFGLAFGVQDRQPWQFVYSADDKLAMIDMDYCFVNKPYDYGIPLSVLLPFQSEKAEVLKAKLSEGYSLMKENLDRHEKQIQKVLNSGKFSRLSRDWKVDLNTSSEEIASSIFQST